MLAPILWSLTIVVTYVLIKQGRVRSVGYNYGLVVRDGEWWRLTVAPACHNNQSHLAISVGAMLYAGVTHPSEWAFGCGSVLVCLGVQTLTLGLVALALASGASPVEFSATDESDARWLARGAVPLGLAWICRADGFDLDEEGPRPWKLAMLLTFVAQLVAPREPALPLLAAAVCGYLIAASASLDAALASPYWTTTSLAWVAFASLASLKATRPHRRVPGLAYSYLPAAAWRRHDDDLEDPDDATLPRFAPDGAPLFYILDPAPLWDDAEIAVADWRIANRRDDDDDLLRLPTDWATEPLASGDAGGDALPSRLPPFNDDDDDVAVRRPRRPPPSSEEDHPL